jgi:hypothetical protein
LELAACLADSGGRTLLPDVPKNFFQSIFHVLDPLELIVTGPRGMVAFAIPAEVAVGVLESLYAEHPADLGERFVALEVDHLLQP